MIEYRELTENEICRELFAGFIRHQNVTKCFRKENGSWIIKDAPFVDDWTESDYAILIDCLKNTVRTGGFLYAAFNGGILKGFASVESGAFGEDQEYLDLSSIHVSEDMRGKDIGKKLFNAANDWAKKKEQKNCTFPLIRRLKHRLFTKPWAVPKRKFITKNILKPSRLTVSLNVSFKRKGTKL